MVPLWPHLRLRLRFAALVAVVSGATALSRPDPPERTLEGLAAFLSREAGGRVAPADVLWEPAGNPVADAVLGRRLLFLAAVPGEPGDLRDVHRARVRVTTEGQPIEVRGQRRLTRTPLSDETGLARRGSLAVYATLTGGRPDGVTLLDLAGPSGTELPSGLAGRAVGHLASWLEFGSISPPGQTRVIFTTSPESLRVAVLDGRIRVELTAPEAAFAVEPGSTRAVPLGPMADGLVRIGHPANRGRPALPWLRRSLESGPVGDPIDAAALPLSVARSGLRRLQGLSLTRPEAADRFAPVSLPWLPQLAEGGAHAPYFHTGRVAPAAARPFEEVHLVRLDLRQVELHLAAGYERPAPSAGLPGVGRIPGEIAPRVVAAFAVASPSPRGWSAEGRRVAPLVDNMTTWMVTKFGQSFFGDAAPGPVPAEEVHSLLQSPSPFAEVESRVLEGLSALCATRDGEVYYAWSEASTRVTFARALRGVRCERGVRLAEAPSSTGFAFLRLEGGGLGHEELVQPAMTLRPARLVSGSEDDFVYVTLRGSPSDGGSLAFAPSPGAQPEPEFIAGIQEATRKLGELEIRVLRFEAGRFDWTLRAGRGEPSAALGRPKRLVLGPDDLPRSLAAIGLGHTTEALRYGLAFEGKPSLDLRRGYATLVLRSGKDPRVFGAGETWSHDPLADAVQVPLLADDDQVVRSASDQGPMRPRGALCVTGGGATLVALARHDSSDPLGAVLLAAGCSRVVSLDRGSRHAAFVDRSGTAQAPAEAYAVTVLHALGRPMTPPVELY